MHAFLFCLLDINIYRKEVRISIPRLHLIKDVRVLTSSSLFFFSFFFLSRICCCCWSLLYIAMLRSRIDSLHLYVILHEWIAFYSAFLNIHRSGVLTALAWLVPQVTAAISAQVLCPPYNHAPSHFMQSHIRKVYACLAVTCHRHFWQNDRGLLRATAVTEIRVTDTEIRVSTESWPWRRKVSRRSCRDSNPRPSITSPAL